MPWDQFLMMLISSGIANYILDDYFLVKSIPDEFSDIEDQLYREEEWRNRN